MSKYYIIKGRGVSKQRDILMGIRKHDKHAEMVDNLDDCDVAVLQKGWTRSKFARADYAHAKSLRIRCDQGHYYIDKCKGASC